MQNVSSRKLCAFYTVSTFYVVNFLDLFYADGAMRHTAKSNMLNEIEISKYSLPSFMGNPDLGLTVTDFIVILQSIDYIYRWNFSKTPLKTPLLVAVTDGYDFEFSIEAAERKRWIEDSTHMQEIEIIDSQKFPKVISKLPWEFKQ